MMREDAAWRRPDDQATEERSIDQQPPATDSGAGVTRSELPQVDAEAPPVQQEAAVAPPVPAPAAVAASAERELGSPVPRTWLVALAGAVMGGILTVAIYSQAVGSGGSNNNFAFGGPGGPGGGRQQFGQAAPNQAGIPNQGRFQQNQGQGQLAPGGQAQGNFGQQGLQNQATIIGALPRVPDFSGSVRTISGGSMTVDTPQGSRVVQVDGTTQVVLSDGSSGSPSDISRGSVVAVVASTDPNTRLLHADAVGIFR
jgi:hypothetical protein